MKIKRFLFLLLTAALCMGLCACTDAEAPPAEVPQETELNIPPAPSTAPAAEYQDVKVYFDGLLTGRAYLKDGDVFISPSTICAYYDLEMNLALFEGGFNLNMPTLQMTGTSGLEYMQANYRYLYTPEGYLVVGDELYLSPDVIERIFGVDVTVYGDPAKVEISGDGVNIIQGGENYYNINYSADELYWLARIIYSEAGLEPLEGQIGIGNVVYNRVKSDRFPDTVFEVVFQKDEFSVQFDPAYNGGINVEPSEESFIAACLCFEGYSTVGDSMFFVNPQKGDTSWFQSRTFVCSIGNHDFYV